MKNHAVETPPVILSRRGLGTLGLLFCACALIGPARADAQNAESSGAELPGNKFVKVRLALEDPAVAPGGTTNLAVIFDIAPGWHLYWRNPGDSGLPPRVKLQPIAGVTFGAAQWPVPVRRIEEGGLVDYIHERQLVLIFPLTTGSSAAPGTDLPIHAEIDWLVCKDRCVPGRARLSKSLRIAGGAKASADAGVFAAARKHLPKPASGTSKTYETVWGGFDLRLTAKGAGKLTFFPYENEEDVFPEDMLRSGESKTHLLKLHFAQDVTKLMRVSGVLAITRGGVETFHEISVPPPPAEDSIENNNVGRVSGEK